MQSHIRAFVLVLLTTVLLTGMAIALYAGAGLVQAQQSEPDAAVVATATIAHFAPVGTSVLSTSVTVRVNGINLISDFKFGDKSDAIAVTEGERVIQLLPTGTITPIITSTVTLSDDVEYTLAAIGGANGWPLEIYPLEMDSTPFTATAKLRLTHFAPFAAAEENTRVDVCTVDNVPVGGLTGIAYRESSGYLALPPGIYSLKVAPTGSACGTLGGAPTLELPTFALAAGQVVEVFALGLLTEPAFPLQISQSGLRARVAAGHFAPFASQPISTAVSIRVDGSDVITGFVFGELSPYLELPLGSYLVEIIPEPPTGLPAAPVVTSTLILTEFVDYTLAAIGNVVTQPLSLIRFMDDNVTPPPAGQARLRIAHLAPFAASVALTRVDLCTAAGQPPLVGGIGYGESLTINIPASIYSVFVAAAGSNCNLPLVAVPDFVVYPGQIAYVYAIGDIINIAPTLISVPDLSLQQIFLPQVAFLPQVVGE
jgi:hypothetical protein